MYPEGEFLCIVSKQYDRGTREDNNAYVSERVKVRGEHSNLPERHCLLHSDFARTRLTHVMLCLNDENVTVQNSFFPVSFLVVVNMHFFNCTH